MRRESLWLGAAVAGLLAVWGAAGACRSRPVPPSAGEVAAIGEHPVSIEAFESFLVREVGSDAGALDSAVASRLLDRLVAEELVRCWAVEEGLVAADAPAWKAAEAVVRGAAAAPPSRGAVEAWIAANEERFARPARVRLRHLLVADEATARATRAELIQGADFAALARERSLDPYAELGGMVGELGLGDLPLRFDAQLDELEDGELSEVIAASDGYHLFLVEAHLPASGASRDELEWRAEEALRREQGDRALEQVVSQARDRYNVRVWPQNLPFQYEGAHSHEEPPPAGD